MLEEIYGHSLVKQQLVNAWNNQHLPTAYMLVGPNGVGKTSLAIAWTKWANCKHQTICGKCNNCQLFNHKNHPDLIIIKPVKNFIQIQQIRELKQVLSLPTKYAKKRVVLVQNAAKMNLEAANAFLKTLEEPPPDTLLLLSLTEPSSLLPTIRSRCQALFFEPLNNKNLSQVLKQYTQLETTELEFLLRFSAGRVRKNWVQNLAEIMQIHAFTTKQLLQINQNDLGEVLSDPKNPLLEKQHANWTEFFLDLLTDLIKLYHDPTAKITNQPLQADLLKITHQHPMNCWLQAKDNLLQTSLAIQHFSNKGLAIDAFLLKLHRLLHTNA